jgi:hypothetical protein
MRGGIISRTVGVPVMYGKEQGPYLHIRFLGAFANVRKATVSFVMCVCPSEWNNSSCTGRIFMKFDFSVFFENLSKIFSFH